MVVVSHLVIVEVAIVEEGCHIYLYIPLKQVYSIKHGPQKVDPQGYQVMYIELQVLNCILVYC
jgi:hypothetical protein